MSLRSLSERHPVALRAMASAGLFLSTLALYLLTLAPGVYGFDSAELATGVFSQGIVHPPGYPLYLLLGRLFSLLPFGDLAYRLNIMSAFFAALTVVLLFHAMTHILGRSFAAWVAALLFAVSNYFWQMALITEVYTMLTAFLAADLLIVSLWHRNGKPAWLLVFALLYGLTLTVHTSAALMAPAFAWLILRSPFWRAWHWRVVPTMFVLFLAGLLIPYGYLSIRASAHPALDYSQVYGIDLSTPQGIWWFFSGRAYSIFSFGYTWNEIPAEIGRFLSYLWRNTLGIGLILGMGGIVVLWRRSPAWVVGLLLMFAANAAFYVNYRVMDKDTMFLPAYEIWAVFLAAGLAGVQSLLSQWQQREHTGPSLQRAALLVTALILALSTSLNWRWVDMSHADGYIRFAQDMLRGTAPDSVIIAPWSSAVVLEYYQVVEGRRPDLLVINRSRYDVARYYELSRGGRTRDEILAQIDTEDLQTISHYIQDRTIYAAEYDPVLAGSFDYLPEGPIFRLAKPY